MEGDRVHAEPVPTLRRAAPRQRRRRIAPRGWAVLGILVAALVVGGGVGVRAAGGWLMLAARAVGFVAHFWQPKVVRPGGVPVAPTPVRPEEPFSVLVLGTEQAPQYAGPQLTDSMMVMSFDPASKTATILSVPRDLWMNIPTVGEQRINVAYEFGGVALAKLAVEQAIGVPIEYYAIVNYQSFVNLVNAVGGINVVVPQNIDDTCFPNPAENQCTVFRLAAGPQHLDGQTALDYIRERHVLPGGDLSREADQQQALLALKSALLQPANLPQLPTILGDVFGAVQTDVPYADAAKLAAEILQLPRSSIHTAVFNTPVGNTPGAVVPFVTKGGADVLLPNDAVIQQIVQQNFQGLRAPLGQYVVQVFNGTPSPDPLATEFSKVLNGMGVQTLQAAPADRTDYANNEVFINTSRLQLAPNQPVPVEAYMLAQMLDTQVQQGPVPQSQAPIVVILGQSYPGG
jgi:LCP family protein required for cell wall assembly